MIAFWDMTSSIFVEVQPTGLSDMRAASIINAKIAVMMKAVRTSKTSVYFNKITRSHIPESCLHTRRRENLKTHNRKHV
jgi:hypothetical protein